MQHEYMVIGRVRNSDGVDRLVVGIRSRGYSCFNFLETPGFEKGTHPSWDAKMDAMESHPDFWNDPEHMHYFKYDLEGLLNADTVVLLTPAGLAAHMELGIAFGCGKKIVLIGEVEKPETLYLMFEEPGNERFDTIESFLDSIK